MSARPMRNSDEIPLIRKHGREWVRLPLPKPCVHCGNEFQPDSPARILCSEPCVEARRAEQTRLNHNRSKYKRSPHTDAKLPDPEVQAMRKRIRAAMEDGLTGPELRQRFGPRAIGLAKELRAEMEKSNAVQPERDR